MPSPKDKQVKTREEMARLAAPEVGQRISKGELEIQTGGREQELTVLYSNICGFAELCAQQSSSETVRHAQRLSRTHGGRAV